MTAGAAVQALYEAYRARAWDAAGELFHPDVVVEMPATGERLAGRDEVLGFQRNYPEPWGDLEVQRIVGGGDAAAAEVEVRAPDSTFRLAAFWERRDGLLWRGVEYWLTLGGQAPPPGRESFR